MHEDHDRIDQDIIEEALTILDARLRNPNLAFTNPNDSRDYLKLTLAELEYESFSVMFLDNQNRLLSLKELFRGTVNQAAVYPREVVKAALHFNAAAVILAHNHPSGITTPSEADKHITERLKAALELVDIRTLDHFIVGEGVPYSFAEHGLL